MEGSFIELDLQAESLAIGKDDEDLSEWMDVENTSTNDEKWVCVDQDLSGNLLLSSVSVEPAVNQDFIEELDSEQEEEEEIWEMVEENAVILSTDKSYKRTLTKTQRMQTAAAGVSAVAVAAVFPSAAMTGFLLLNSADLIKLGARGRSSRLILDQKDDSIESVLKRVAIRNGKLSALSISAATVSRMAFYGSTNLLPLLLIEQLNFLSLIGIQFSALELMEKAVAGAIASASTQFVLSKKKTQLYPAPKADLEIKSEKKKKLLVRKAVWGGVSGAAGGLIGPVLNSPVAEKCVKEACTAGSKFLK